MKVQGLWVPYPIPHLGWHILSDWKIPQVAHNGLCGQFGSTKSTQAHSSLTILRKTGRRNAFSDGRCLPPPREDPEVSMGQGKCFGHVSRQVDRLASKPKLEQVCAGPEAQPGQLP